MGLPISNQNLEKEIKKQWSDILQKLSKFERNHQQRHHGKKNLKITSSFQERTVLNLFLKTILRKYSKSGPENSVPQKKANACQYFQNMLEHHETQFRHKEKKVKAKTEKICPQTQWLQIKCQFS